MSLRDTTRRVVRDQIAACAMDLFVRQGFDATTVEQIATASGISSRSFFRYFSTKEAVVLGEPMDLGQKITEIVAAQPRDVRPWPALRRGFDAVVGGAELSPTVLLQSKIYMSTPALRARHLEKQLVWAGMLLPLVVARLAGPDAELRADAIVDSGLACLDVAVGRWASGATASLGGMLDEVMDAVMPVRDITAR